MAKLPLPKTKKGWALLGGGAVIGLGAIFFAATSLMDDDNAAAPRVDPAASSGATPVDPADPAPVDPASPAPLAPPPAPPPVTTFYNIGANARPVPLFTTESMTSQVLGYVGGCYSTTEEGDIREIKINTPEGERTGHINIRGARPGTIVPDRDVTAEDCTGTITAAEDVPITEDYYRMAAGSNILYAPRDGGRVKEYFEESVCLRVNDAVNGNGTDYAAVILSVPGRRAPVIGWASYDDLTIDAACIPQPPQ